MSFSLVVRARLKLGMRKVIRLVGTHLLYWLSPHSRGGKDQGRKGRQGQLDCKQLDRYEKVIREGSCSFDD